LTSFAQFHRHISWDIFISASWAYPTKTWLTIWTSPTINLLIRNLSGAGGDKVCTSAVHRALAAAAAAGNFASMKFFITPGSTSYFFNQVQIFMNFHNDFIC
jgi:hypothetical protein